MDDVITRAEHEEFRRAIDTSFQRLNDEDNRQNKRLSQLEDRTQQISELTVSIQRLATNMENMLKVQEQQGKRLETLEGRDGEMWRKVVGYVATALVSIILGFVFAQIGM